MTSTVTRHIQKSLNEEIQERARDRLRDSGGIYDSNRSAYQTLRQRHVVDEFHFMIELRIFDELGVMNVRI